MRTRGKITYWNDEKGYGFIQPNTGAEKVFVHIRAFGKYAKRPALDEKISYALSTDKQGRPCAVKVTRAGEKRLSKTKSKNYSGYVLFALAFLSVIGVSVLVAGVPILILYVYLAVSIITFIVYAIDKSAAKRGAWRKQENTLHILALIGGWPGALVAQQALRHKSSKRSFRNVFWMTVVLNRGFNIWLITPYGEAWLRLLIVDGGEMLTAFWRIFLSSLG